MEKSVKDRLLEFLEYKNVGQGTFEKQAGISNGYINNLKGSIGTKILNKIELAYPELNINWLRLGSESMLKGPEQVTADSSSLNEYLDIIKSQQKTIETLSDTINKLITK